MPRSRQLGQHGLGVDGGALVPEHGNARVGADVGDPHAGTRSWKPGDRTWPASPKDFATWAACRLESNSASMRVRAERASRVRNSASPSRRSSAFGQRLGFVLADQQAGPAVGQHLRDAGDGRGHAGCAQGHGLEQHGRQPVPVPVGSDHARSSEHGRLANHGDHLVLRQRPQEADPIAQPELVAQCAQRCLTLTGADHVDAEVAAGPAEQRRGAQQVVEALLLHQPPDGSDHGGPVRRIAPAEGGQVQAVVDAMDAVERQLRSGCAGTTG